jgi:dehydrogenase/reductase SDR family member 7B
MNFANKNIWITGASSGIGKALALAFAQRGARLILSARNAAALNQVADACRQMGSPFTLVQPLDLEDSGSLAQVVTAVQANTGPIDILINNGGISQRSLATDTTLAVDEKLMRVNYLGTVALTKAVLPAMIQRKSGHILVVTSLVGKFGSPLRSGYAASKHALHGFFDSLRAELTTSGIHILLVCPGFIRTDISVHALTADGSSQGTMDEATDNGMPPEVLAEKVIRALSNNKQEVWIGGKETIGVYIKRFFPRLFSTMIARAKVT